MPTLRVHGHIGDGFPVDEDVARIRMQESGDHAQRGGLAAAARAEQRDDAAGLDEKRHAIDGTRRAELLDQFAQANRGCHDRSRLRHRRPDCTSRATWAGSG
jgi:hypothetical protein